MIKIHLEKHVQKKKFQLLPEIFPERCFMVLCFSRGN